MTAKAIARLERGLEDELGVPVALERPSNPEHGDYATNAAMRAGTLTCRDLVTRYLRRIEAFDRNGPGVNAIVVVAPDALAVADSLDARMRAGGAIGSLHCVPTIVNRFPGLFTSV